MINCDVCTFCLDSKDLDEIVYLIDLTITSRTKRKRDKINKELGTGHIDSI
jgi:hypothetical protein